MTTALDPAGARREIALASVDFGYFLQHHVRLAEADPEGNLTGAIDWEWWPDVHDRLTTDLGVHRRLIVLKARQLGVSWELAAWLVHGALFQPGFLGGVVSAGEREAARFVGKCRFVAAHLRWPAAPPSLSTDNDLEIAFASSGGRILGYPSTAKAGRGDTYNRWVADEAAFHPHAARNFAAYSAATVGTIVVVSSAGDDERTVQTDWFQRQWEGAERGDNGFVPRFFGALSRPGRDAAWYEGKRRELAATPGQLEREYPLTPSDAFRSMLLLRYDAGALEAGHQYASTQVCVHTSMDVDVPAPLLGCKHLRVWSLPRPGVAYVLATDGAEGKGIDYSTTFVLEARTLRHVATLRENTLEPGQHGRLVAALAKWYNDAWCIVERSHGEAILVQLALAGCRLYHHRTPEQAKAGQPGTVGFPMTAATRPGLIADLAQAVYDRAFSSPDPVFWDEASVFVVDPDTGRAEAARGRHDDTQVAAALAVRMAGQPEAQTVREPARIEARPSSYGYVAPGTGRYRYGRTG